VQIMLNALPSLYEGFIQSIIAQDELPSVTKLTNKLLYGEQRLQSKKLKVPTNETLLMSSYRGQRGRTNRVQGRSGQGRLGEFNTGRAISTDNGDDSFSNMTEPRQTTPWHPGVCNKCCHQRHWVCECPQYSNNEQKNAH